ncbi:hypothetical protein [Actinomadura alba]|uniref:Uncharacterized protein n=1 Tax=Actinomadura alba TaxID=406431 RepID=A0ABR7LWV4_9ACTN|nr:hypothetical protein [Actinomadura alba]MBC6469158.1 hypothetical protein [Actinomadura alba]
MVSNVYGRQVERQAIADLPATLPAAARSTYVYEGNSQVLDHVLLSRPATATSCTSTASSPPRRATPQVVRLPLP